MREQDIVGHDINMPIAFIPITMWEVEEKPGLDAWNQKSLREQFSQSPNM